MNILNDIVDYVQNNVTDAAPINKIRYKFRSIDYIPGEEKEDHCVLEIVRVERDEVYGGGSTEEAIGIQFSFVFAPETNFSEKFNALKNAMFGLNQFSGEVGDHEVTRITVTFGAEVQSEITEFAAATYTLTIEYNL